MSELLRQIASYLEPLGYQLLVSEQSTTVRAEHERYLNFSLVLTAGGVLLRSYISTSPLAKSADLLAFANDLNRSAAVVRFLIDKDGDFALEAWWPPLADREQFLNFIEAWHHDMGLIGDHERSMDLLL